MLLGVIGDDFTGSSDIGNTLAKSGMKVVQYNGIPNHEAAQEVEAGVISLKSRSIPVQEAVDQSLAAAHWLLAQGCEQLYFKYCSTFDSTKQGNIGPVTQALANLVGEDKVIICPAFPDAGRTVYQGQLFVEGLPLHESGMKDHPLTPMSDSDLRRWLQYQTDWVVTHIPYADVLAGADRIGTLLDDMEKSMIVVDLITNDDFAGLGKALSSRRLITGASGLAIGAAQNFARAGKLSSGGAGWVGNSGPAVILSGSCSIMTRKQVAHYKQTAPFKELSAAEVVLGEIKSADLVAWALDQAHAPLIYTSTEPAVVKQAQSEFGLETSAEAIEDFFGQLAIDLVESGVRIIVTAGGETSGAVVRALDISSMIIGPEIAAGVPALRAENLDLVIALKSGNFGDTDFFKTALDVLDNE